MATSRRPHSPAIGPCALAIAFSLLVVVPAVVPPAGALNLSPYDTLNYASITTPQTSFPVKDEIANWTYARVSNLNYSDGTDIAHAVLDIKNATLENATAIRSKLLAASNASDTVHAAQDAALGYYVPGVRTNLSTAHSPNGLYHASVALYGAFGVSLTDTQKLAIQTKATRAELTNAAAATAGAVMAFATIDALHYLNIAYRQADADAWGLIENATVVFATLQRRMLFEEQSDGSLALKFDPLDQEVLDAGTRFGDSIDQDALFQALDVLSQAADEISAMTFLPPLRGEEFDETCSPSHTHLFVLSEAGACLLILGGNTNDDYYQMQSFGNREMNAVLIDFGGNDKYHHRAGGGFGSANAHYTCDRSVTPPRCWTPVQTLIDLGNGNDLYKPGYTGAVEGPAQGAGVNGIGLLYDAGGDDRYNATHAIGSDRPTFAQGAGNAGAGLLYDKSGNDVYEGWHHSRGNYLTTQAVAYEAGIGVLADRAGHDQYYHNVTNTSAGSPVDGGGSQGFASIGGISYLVDKGAGDDLYYAGQDMVQGAASYGSLAALVDESGNDRFTIQSSLGCVDPVSKILDGKIDRTYCKFSAKPTYEPIAGSGWGFGTLGGFGTLLSGNGDSVYDIRVYGGGASTGNFEGRLLLGAGNTTGLGIVVETGGNDDYTAMNASFGYADRGVGIFVDLGGDDHYRCSSSTCYGYENEGAGVYHDEGSSQDVFECGIDPTVTSSWYTTPRGIGLHIAPENTDTCTCSGGGDDRSIFKNLAL